MNYYEIVWKCYRRVDLINYEDSRKDSGQNYLISFFNISNAHYVKYGTNFLRLMGRDHFYVIFAPLLIKYYFL